jgi:hypothetical protein
MKLISLLALLALFSLPAIGEEPDTGLVALKELGQLNGQALACSQFAQSGKAKAMMIRHAPKTRRFGEVFEEATNASFLTQGSNPDSCPSADGFASRLGDLAVRLQAALPATP